MLVVNLDYSKQIAKLAFFHEITKNLTLAMLVQKIRQRGAKNKVKYSVCKNISYVKKMILRNKVYPMVRYFH